MNLGRIKYEDGRPYIEYLHKTGRKSGESMRVYGQIITCLQCGKKAFAQDNDIKKGNGRFCSLPCKQLGENNPSWKNARIKTPQGYIKIFDAAHRDKNGRHAVYEHRLIIERQIGRYLHRWESVHHINKIKADNRPNNLMAFKNHGTHTKYERGKRVNSSNIIFDGSETLKGD